MNKIDFIFVKEFVINYQWFVKWLLFIIYVRAFCILFNGIFFVCYSVIMPLILSLYIVDVARVQIAAFLAEDIRFHIYSRKRGWHFKISFS